MKSCRLTLAILAVCLLSSDLALGGFTTVVNIPPDAMPPDGQFDADTQINLLAGAPANLGDVFRLGGPNAPVENAELNVLGGSAWSVEAWTGSQINVFTGSVGGANLLGARGTMSSGAVNSWSLFSNSRLEMSGGITAQINTAGLTDSDAPRAAMFIMTGGTVGVLDATGNARIQGGSVETLVFRGGGFVEVSGGSIGDDFEVGGVVTGAIPEDPTREIVVGSGGRVAISGGSIGRRMVVRSGRTLDYSGGVIGDAFQALEGSQVDIRGSHFFLDGVALNGTAGEKLVIPQRGVTLEGVLADGLPFRFDLNGEPGHGDYFSIAATVSVIAAPEPAMPVGLALGILTLLSCGRSSRSNAPVRKR